MIRFRRALLPFLIAAPLSMLYAQGPPSFAVAGGYRIIEQGQPGVVIHATVDEAERVRAANGQAGTHGAGTASTVNNLSYRGGVGGIGVETAPKVYLVYWGSQWSKDPSNEAGLLETFYKGVGGSSWLNSVTQYCQGVASGTVICGTSGTHAGNSSVTATGGVQGMLAGILRDNGSLAPAHPRQSQLAAEAIRAAQIFGNTTASSNASVQYVIATATGNSSNGFGSQYCAYHSATSSSYGNIAYTNLPYITDAGASCGANFNGLGPTAGITIVGGHELAETITDQFPNGGWLDSSGEENGDKCAWISTGAGASTNISLTTGTFPVQTLWSNATSGGSCALSYP